MSAEVKKPEANAENKEKDTKEEEDVKEKEVDELKEEPQQPLSKRIKGQWQLILKVVQLVLCALCFAFFFQAANQSTNNIAKYHLDQVGLIFLAYVGYMLINTVFILSRCIKDTIPFRISALFALIASLLFFISGILLIVDRRNKFQGVYYEPYMYLAGMLSAATVLSFVNAIFFALDGVYTFILKKDF